MNQDFLFGHVVLVQVPVWALATGLFLLCIGAVHLMRGWFEGFPYNVASSSEIGDAALAGVVLIGATVIQRNSALPESISNLRFHAIAGGIALAAGCYFLYMSRDSQGKFVQWADLYHNIAIAPVIAYLMVITAPVIFLRGTFVEKCAMVGFGFVWVLCVVFDAHTGRLDQRTWVEKQGVKLQ